MHIVIEIDFPAEDPDRLGDFVEVISTVAGYMFDNTIIHVTDKEVTIAPE